MRIGVPKEIKVLEYRVGLTPGSVREVAAHGHQVVVEHDAGRASAWTTTPLAGRRDDRRHGRRGLRRRGHDRQGEGAAGGRAKDAARRPDPVHLLHLAPDPEQAADLVASGAVCIAYETVTSASGGLPLLAPMSEVAGRMAIQAGAYFLEKPHGGLGVLLGGVPGVDPAKVVVLGGGVVGSHACHIALGMGAEVWVLDRSNDVLRALWRQFGRPLNTVFSTRDAIERHVTTADLVVGGVLIPGASAPKLVSRELVARMKPGSVVVDVAIDQGGCFETSHPTTHADPVYVVDGVTHYCVANMPGGVPRTSTFALNNATLPFVLALADRGWKGALAADPHLLAGLNIAFGKVTCAPVAEALGYAYVEPNLVME